MAEDRKFKFEDGRFVNRVSGEPIPDDEPVILFRARDKHALGVLEAYRSMVADEHHRQAVTDRIEEFKAYRLARPDRLKEPGITRDIVLNAEAPTIAGPNVCPWCSEGIRPGEPTAVSDGERMHLSCAAEEMDSIGFDRDRED